MTRLAQTAGLTDAERHHRCRAGIRRSCGDSRSARTRAHRHVSHGHRQADERHGSVRVTIDEEFGGIGESPRLRAVRRGIGSRLDERVRCHQHPFHSGAHDFGARDAGTEGEVPAASGYRGAHRRIFDVGAGPGFRRCCHLDQGEAHESGDYVVTGQKMWLTNGGSSTLVAVLVKTDEGAEKPHNNLTTMLIEKPAGFRRSTPGPDHPRQAREDGLQGNRHDGDDFRRFRDRRRRGSRRQSRLGFRHMMDGAEVGRVNVAARACGIAQRAFELAVHLCKSSVRRSVSRSPSIRPSRSGSRRWAPKSKRHI